MNERGKESIWELAAADIHKATDENEKRELDHLMNQRDNKEIYDNISELHDKLEQTRPLHHTSACCSWKEINRSFKKRKIRLYLKMAKYAAIVIIAFGIGTLFHFNRKPVSFLPDLYTTVYAPLGQMSELTLPDGTHVWLNSGSTLAYPNRFGDRSREVKLEGEAFFNVTKGEIPFRVKLKEKEVEVLGTSFAAVAYPDEDFSQVVLVEGSVMVYDQTGRSLKKIEPGQMLHIPDRPEEKITHHEVSLLFYQSWIAGQIRFDEERLADVARRMERWYNVEIKFADETARNLRFTGTVLKNKPVDQSLQAISLLLPIRVKYENNLATKDVITISKK